MGLDTNNDSDEDIWEYKSCKRVKSSVSVVLNKTSKRGGDIAQKADKSQAEGTLVKKTSDRRLVKGSRKDEAVTDAQSVEISADGNTKATNQAPTQVDDGYQSNNPINLASSQENTQPKPKSSKKKRKTPAKTPAQRVKHEGNCPHCQMPFESLVVESPRWHTMECMDLPIIAERECHDGLYCDNTIASHFRRFKHTTLARKRAGFEGVEDPSLSNELVEKVTHSVINKGPKQLDFGSNHQKLISSQVGCVSSDDEIGFEPLPSSCTPANCIRDGESVSLTTNDVGLSDLHTTPTKPNSRLKHDSTLASPKSPYFKQAGSASLGEQTHEEDSCMSEADIFCSPSPTQADGFTSAKDLLLEGGSLEFPESAFSEDVGVEGVVTTERDVLADSSQTNEKSAQGYESLSQSPLSAAGTRQLSISSFFGGSGNKCASQKDVSQHVRQAPKQNIQHSSQVTKNPASNIPPLRRNGTSNAMGASYGDHANTSQSHTSTGSFGRGQKRPCPFYKKIPGTPFTVDAFRYGVIPGCKAYFLSHFHYDHYGGLSKKFGGNLYCSKVTANLVKKKIKVADGYITTIPLDIPTMVMEVEVTFMEANHCPGAVIMLFKLPNGRIILHTGDFRADAAMQTNSALVGLRIDELFLDTTYCQPQHKFPPQRDVINYSVVVATDFVHQNPNTLIVVGSYTIGKERLFLAIAEALNCKIFVTREKKNVLDCLEDENINRRLTRDLGEAKIHVLPMKELNYPCLIQYLDKLKGKYDTILGFEPSGWAYSRSKTSSLDDIRPKVNSKRLVLYAVPYSEHSSYSELRDFVQFTRPEKILPTVNNGNPASRRQMDNLFKSWLSHPGPSGSSPARRLRQSAISTWFSG